MEKEVKRKSPRIRVSEGGDLGKMAIDAINKRTYYESAHEAIKNKTYLERYRPRYVASRILFYIILCISFLTLSYGAYIVSREFNGFKSVIVCVTISFVGSFLLWIQYEVKISRQTDAFDVLVSVFASAFVLVISYYISTSKNKEYYSEFDSSLKSRIEERVKSLNDSISGIERHFDSKISKVKEVNSKVSWVGGNGVLVLNSHGEREVRKLSEERDSIKNSIRIKANKEQSSYGEISLSKKKEYEVSDYYIFAMALILEGILYVCKYFDYLYNKNVASEGYIYGVTEPTDLSLSDAPLLYSATKRALKEPEVLDITNELAIFIPVRECKVCKTDISHLRSDAKTCGSACRSIYNKNKLNQFSDEEDD